MVEKVSKGFHWITKKKKNKSLAIGTRTGSPQINSKGREYLEPRT